MGLAHAVPLGRPVTPQTLSPVMSPWQGWGVVLTRQSGAGWGWGPWSHRLGVSAPTCSVHLDKLPALPKSHLKNGRNVPLNVLLWK